METASQHQNKSATKQTARSLGTSDTGEDQGSLRTRVMELGVLLQTTLEWEQQIDLFHEEVGREISLGSLTYTNETEQLERMLGEKGSHRATYDIKVSHEQLGHLQITRNTPFQEAELVRFENLMVALIYPLRNALTYRRAVQAAFRDPLTGAQNRSSLDMALQREIDLATRQDSSLSLIVLDIDHFKSVNDRFGHVMGDDVLRAVAQITSNSIRRSDLLFRYGGEEFVILTSHTNSDGAHLLAERIRQRIAANESVAGTPMHVTASFGVSTLHPGDTPITLFQRADEALYRAKNGGRNRVEIS